MPVAILAIVALAYVLWASGMPNPLAPKEPFPKKPLGDFIPGDRIIIVGLPLSGKTYLAAKLTANVPRILYFDPYHDYGKFENVIEISADELIENPNLLAESRFRYAVIPNEDELAMQLEEVVSIARAAGNLVFVMDEVGDYKQEAEKTLTKLARNGRHNGLVPIYVSQVAMDIPRTVRRLATRVYSFRQEDIDDLDALRERYGDEYAEKVSNLPEHEHALWKMKGFGRSQVADFPKHRPSNSSQSETS